MIQIQAHSHAGHVWILRKCSRYKLLYDPVFCVQVIQFVIQGETISQGHTKDIRQTNKKALMTLVDWRVFNMFQGG